MRQHQRVICTADSHSFTTTDLRRIVGNFRREVAERVGDTRVTVSVVCRQRLHEALAAICGLFSPVVTNLIKPELSVPEIVNVLKHAGSSVLVTDEMERVQRYVGSGIEIINSSRLFSRPLLRARCDLGFCVDELVGSLLLYTSGTTGAPKGVLLSKDQLQANVRISIDEFKYSPDSVAASVLPAHHIFSLMNDLIAMLCSGGRCVLLDIFEIQKAQHLADQMRAHGVQHFSGVPTILEAMLRLRVDLPPSSLEYVVAGAAPLRESTRLAFAETYGIEICPCYGMVEAANFITISPRGAARPGAVGRPVGAAVRIVDDSDIDVMVGHPGNIVIHGDTVMHDGYFRSKRTITELYTSDGWFRTGDLGRLDADGYLYITGRRKNMVIRGGDKLYLEDIDRAVAAQIAVEDCASIAVLGEHEEIVTFVKPTIPSVLSGREIRHHIHLQLGPRYVPDMVFIVDQIPRSDTGKLRSDLLQQLYQDKREGSAAHGRS